MSGFIVAYPQALIPDAGGYDWNIPGVPLLGGQNPPANAANDVTFLTGLVRSLEARYCVSTSRVYATGMSGGGRMVSQLACDASQTFAAVAPVCGLCGYLQLRLLSAFRQARCQLIAFPGG